MTKWRLSVGTFRLGWESAHVGLVLFAAGPTLVSVTRSAVMDSQMRLIPIFLIVLALTGCVVIPYPAMNNIDREEFEEFESGATGKYQVLEAFGDPLVEFMEKRLFFTAHILSSACSSPLVVGIAVLPLRVIFQTSATSF